MWEFINKEVIDNSAIVSSEKGAIECKDIQLAVISGTSVQTLILIQIYFSCIFFFIV